LRKLKQIALFTAVSEYSASRAWFLLMDRGRYCVDNNHKEDGKMMIMKKILGVSLFLSLALCASTVMAQVGTITLAEVENLVQQTPEEGGYMLIDARPEVKFYAGHLPWAKSLPWQEMQERLDELPTDKAIKLVFYCGGLKCDLSNKAAELAVAQGFTDVFVFPQGEPGWKDGGHPVWVATNHIKMVLNDRDRVALLVDARPFIKYNEGTVPGAMNLPFQEWDKLQGLLPADKAAQMIFFCGGFKCDLSHKSAAKAQALGYTDVRVYAEGWPVWKSNSSRAFAMVNPKQGSSADAKPEEIVYEGEISAEEFTSMMENQPEGFLLVDCRPAEEFEKGHLPGAVNILDEKVGEHAEMLKQHAQIVFYCATGSRAAAAFYAAEDVGIETTQYLNRTVDIQPDGSYEIK